MRQNITLNWSLNHDHGRRMKSSHKWERALAAKMPKAQSKVEAALGWPPGTLEVLTHALGMRLTRSVEWDLSQISDPRPFQMAASVFMRGVRFHPSGMFESPQFGTTQIIFVNCKKQLKEYLTDPRNFVVVDGNTYKHHRDMFDKPSLVLEDPREEDKDLQTVAHVLNKWHDQGQPERWIICGGGIVSDICGFAASLAQSAKLSLSLVPTTLLAMADAAIGGKTGVNVFPYGKNMVGSFFFPEKVLIFSGWLTSLLTRDLLAGGSECLKHAIIAGDLKLAESLSHALGASQISQIDHLLPEIIRIKTRIVERDLYESGSRKVLNLGHTLGHALEGFSHTYGKQNGKEEELRHGEAVATGLVYSMLAGKNLGRLSTHLCDSWLEIIERSRVVPQKSFLEKRLGTSLRQAWPRLQQWIALDKKRTVRTHQPKWIIPHQTNSNKPLKCKEVELAQPLAAKTWDEFCLRLS